MSTVVGATPAVALYRPKFDVNVSNAQRACACFGVGQLWWTGDRVKTPAERGHLPKGQGRRLPREERMKGYASVELRRDDYFFDAFPRGTVPVAVELRPGGESLADFVHPERALYVFGPEDGSLPGPYLRHCHRFVCIPIRHYLNLAAAVYVVLYDRVVKRHRLGLEPLPELVEPRGHDGRVALA